MSIVKCPDCGVYDLAEKHFVRCRDCQESDRTDHELVMDRVFHENEERFIDGAAVAFGLMGMAESVRRTATNDAVVWADEATPFTGAEVKALLDENEALRRQVQSKDYAALHRVIYAARAVASKHTHCWFDPWIELHEAIKAIDETHCVTSSKRNSNPERVR